MAKRGQFKPPVLPLAEAHARVIHMIGRCDDRVAIFMIGGRLSFSSPHNRGYERRIKTLAANLVGIYDFTIDYRVVLADLNEFYKQAGEATCTQ